MAGIVVRGAGAVCADCGQAVDPRAFVCLNCGAALQDPAGMIPPPPGMAGPGAAYAPPPAAPPPLPPPAWGGTNPTDSFTFHVPSPAAPLPPAPPAPPPGPPPPAVEVVEEDDHTVVVVRRPRAEWALRLASGERVLVDGTLLLGRRPVAEAGPAGARLVVVDDPGRTVSRSHLVVEPRPGAGIVLRDVSSANGVVLIAADGAESGVEPGGEVLVGEPCRVVLGAVILLVEPV